MNTHASVSVHHVTIDETWIGDGTVSAWVTVGPVTLYFASTGDIVEWARHVAGEAVGLGGNTERVVA